MWSTIAISAFIFKYQYARVFADERKKHQNTNNDTQQYKVEGVQEVFKLIDKDGEGFITLDKLREVKSWLPGNKSLYNR